MKITYQNKKMGWTVCLALLILSPLNLLAKDKDDRNPLGCRDLGYQFDMKTLSLVPADDGTGHSLYFLYNKSGKAVTLYQMRDEDSARSVYFNHKIDTNYWAVLATAEKKMRFICTVEGGKSAYGQIIDCGDYLKVCEYNHVKFGMNNRGNYWLANSNTKGGAINAVIRYGIIPAM